MDLENSNSKNIGNDTTEVKLEEDELQKDQSFLNSKIEVEMSNPLTLKITKMAMPSLDNSSNIAQIVKPNESISTQNPTGSLLAPSNPQSGTSLLNQNAPPRSQTSTANIRSRALLEQDTPQSNNQNQNSSLLTPTTNSLLTHPQTQNNQSQSLLATQSNQNHVQQTQQSKNQSSKQNQGS